MVFNQSQKPDSFQADKILAKPLSNFEGLLENLKKTISNREPQKKSGFPAKAMTENPDTVKLKSESGFERNLKLNQIDKFLNPCIEFRVRQTYNSLNPKFLNTKTCHG